MRQPLPTMKHQSPETFCTLHAGKKLAKCWDGYLKIPWHNRRPVVDWAGYLTGECVWRDAHTGEIDSRYEYAEITETGDVKLISGTCARTADAAVSKWTARDILVWQEDHKEKE